MRRLNYFHKSVVRAALCGGAALVLNLLTSMALPISFFLPLGNIFLFISAAAFGIPGAIVATSIAVVPGWLFADSNLFLVLRLFLLSLAIGGASKRYPSQLESIVALGTWLAVLLPLAGILNYVGIETIDSRTLLFASLSDLFLVVAAGTILINNNVWNKLTDQLRHIQLEKLLPHVMVACSVTALFALFVAPIWGRNSMVDLVEGRNSFSVGLILFLGVAFPALLGSVLSRLIIRDYHDLVPQGMLPQKRLMTFSGLSSEFWRRQSATDSDLTTMIPSPRSASGSDEGARQGGPGIIPPDHGILALNRNGTITFLNRKFRKFAEITTNDVIGKNIEQIGMNPGFCKSILALIEPTFEKGARVSEIKVNQLPDKLRFFEVSSQRSDQLENSSMNDGPDSIILTAKDITDRRTVEKHLLQAKKVESLGSIVNGIAHAFNNSLTAITGMASIARHSLDGSMTTRALDAILSSARDAGNVVRQLLNFASSEEHPMRNEDLEKLLRDRIDFFQKSVGEDFEITFQGGEKPLPVLCNANLFMQVIANLILNAKESYSQGSGPISISVASEVIDEAVSELVVGARPGLFARLRVKDTGCGMTPETLSRAFDPLYTTKGSSGHTGLGLSIVYAIVRAHDGFLTAESHPDKGTSVTIYIPLVSDATMNTDASRDGAMEPAARTSSDLPRGNNQTVLIVEDEKTVRDMVVMMLSNLGYTTIAAENGTEALTMMQSTPVALIIADLVLPKMGGAELLQKVRESFPEVKSVLMTGYGIVTDGVPSGVSVLPKPFDLDTLAWSVHKIVSEA